MSSNGISGPNGPAAAEPIGHRPLTRWQRIRLVIKVVELRLRFVALMAVTGLTFAYWDTIWNRYDKWMRPSAQHLAASAGIEHYCPMHPQVVQESPGGCPICGMPLARRKKGEKATLPEGVTARVLLEPRRVAQAGIGTAEVGYAPLAQTLTAVGYVAYDERLLATIPSKVPGRSRVEVLHANVTGMEVAAGQPLAEMYSPELYQAIAELRTAKRAEQESAGLQTAAARSIVGDRRSLVRLASEKLKRWGISQSQIDEILGRPGDDYKVPIYSPIGGTVVRKNVVQGQEVPEGFAMFEVADLSRVWIQAQVYEQQMEMVREGQEVEATVEAFPGRSFPGKVTFLQPTVDPSTRTVEVRFDLANPDRLLRPGMFATVTLKVPVVDSPAFAARSGAVPHDHAEGGQATASLASQEKCPVTSLKLGAMGEPVPVQVEGRKVWTCCGACEPKLKAHPAKYLARLAPPPRDGVLSVPESAVIDTGRRTIVYVEAEPGVFEGREVVLGPRVGDRFPVLQGLAVGEKVAARGAFLIDAESRINPGSAPQEPSPPPRPEAPTHRSASAPAPAPDALRR